MKNKIIIGILCTLCLLGCDSKDAPLQYKVELISAGNVMKVIYFSRYPGNSGTFIWFDDEGHRHVWTGEYIVSKVDPLEKPIRP